MDAKKITNKHILTKASRKGSDNTDTLSVMKRYKNNKDKYKIGLADTVEYERKNGALQNKRNKRRH